MEKKKCEEEKNRNRKNKRKVVRGKKKEGEKLIKQESKTNNTKFKESDGTGQAIVNGASSISRNVRELRWIKRRVYKTETQKLHFR
jgi:hypothetical protein